MGKLLKNKKLLIIVVVVLLAGGFAAKKILLKPPPVDEKKLAKEEGAIFTIPEEFVVNLATGPDGVSHFARATVSLGVSKLSVSRVPAEAEGATTPASIEGQAKIQDLIRDVLSERTREDLLTKRGRDEVKETIVTLVNRDKDLDLKIVEVYLPRFAVQ